MPKIEFLANGIGPTKLANAPEGGELVDICDLFFAPVPFSCRSASCGTCQVHVLEGAELFDPPEPNETELLDILGGKGTRLACQARIKPGPGLIRLRSVIG